MGFEVLVAAPKLEPEVVPAPVPKAEDENIDEELAAAVAEGKREEDVFAPNIDGVVCEVPNIEGVCKAPEDPKMELGAEVACVEKRKDEELEDDAGALNMENPAPDEAAVKVPGVDSVEWDMPDKEEAGAAELVNKPAT